jgi:8-oxo-dGTP diphosphatase
MSRNQSAENPQQPLRETHVVTSFLLRTDMGQPRILIVRRSQRVGSYNARWGGISGFVEEGVTPDEQAFTEIREETGLQGEQIRMLRRGAVVEVEDPAIGRHWYVHPFLFEALTPDAINLDWEATEKRWIEPAELRNYETVPKLQEAYVSATQGEEVQGS